MIVTIVGGLLVGPATDEWFVVRCGPGTRIGPITGATVVGFIRGAVRMRDCVAPAALAGPGLTGHGGLRRVHARPGAAQGGSHELLAADPR